MLILGCTGKLMFIGGTMKFLKINAKVLLILCLFSGILFLSTGCDENKDSVMCEECAEQYWITLDYKLFRVE